MEFVIVFGLTVFAVIVAPWVESALHVLIDALRGD